MSLANLYRAVLTALCVILSATHICWAATTSHSDFLFKNIGIEQGLSSREVFAVEQDHEGYIWLGTADGLNRYDGYEIKVFKHEEEDTHSLSDSKVNCLLTDSQGRLWVGTNRGLNLYEASSCSFSQSLFLKENQSELAEEAIRCLYEDKEGDIWIGTMHGLYRLSVARREYSRYSLRGIDGSRNRGIVRSILEDSLGNMWIGTYDGLLRLHTQTGEIQLVDVREIRPLIPENNLILSLMIDPEDQRYLWVGSETGLHRLDILDETYITYTHENTVGGLSNNVVKCLYPLGNEYLVAGTDYGLDVLDKRTGKAEVFFHDSFKSTTIANDIVWDIMQDQDGEHWFATSNGVSQIVYSGLNLNIHEIDQPDPSRPSPDNQVIDIAFDAFGGRYVSLDNRVFYDHPSGERTFYQFANYSDVKVKNLLVDQKGTVWAGTSNSLWYKDVGNQDFERISSRNLRYVNSITEDRDGHIWAESVNGVCRIVPERNAKDKITQMNFTYFPLENGTVRSVRSSMSYVDSQNRLWFMSKDLCLHVCNGNANEEHRYRLNTPESGLKGTVIYSYVETSDLYVLTDEGIHRYEPDNDRFVHINLASQLDTPLTSMVSDQYGQLWLSTGSKLLRFNTENNSVIFFDLADYLAGKVLPVNPLHVSTDGCIWVGGYNQYFHFMPAESYEVTNDMKVHFTDVKVYGESRRWQTDPQGDPEIILGSEENTLEFCWSIFDFHSPQNLQYTFRLEGLEKHWRNISGSNKVSYSNLAPGQYELHVRVVGPKEQYLPVSVMKVRIHYPWWFSSWAIFFYCLLGGGLFYYLWRTARTSFKLREKVRMEEVERQSQEELMQYKIRFFTNISHELKTPLALILGPLEDMMEEASAPDQQQRLEIMHSNASRLLRMVSQVMDFNKMERGAIRLHPVEGELVAFIKRIFDMFQSEARNRNISYSFLSEWETYVTAFDDDKIEKIVYNLLSNAFKYTSDRGSISIRLRKCNMRDKEGIEICVEDNGTGIPENERDKIFTRFYQSENADVSRTGTGIGLSLAKDFVDMMEGEISVSSGPEGGSLFSVRLPMDMINYAEVEMEESKEEGSEGKCILVVDDNLEMCSFMQLSLEKEYKVILAHDGEEGLRKVRKYNPDIIISDLMMPVMDGLEFCRRIKEDESVSHIPFILLTAKDGEENVYHGLQTGADAYISKPFNMKLLKLRLENLYETRRKMQSYLTDRLKYGESESSPENKEVFTDPFVDKVVQTIKSNLSDDSLDVGCLSGIMNLPKQQLYRKVKALTGLTIVELIRSVRLEAAAQRLRESNDTISEIMYGVGFSNNSYFSKCFAEQFKVSPSEYRKKHSH